jgi:hypothetical protein
MISHLDLERGLEDRLGQPRQRATRPDQVPALAAGPVDQILRQLLMRIIGSRHVVDRLVHR